MIFDGLLEGCDFLCGTYDLWLDGIKGEGAWWVWCLQIMIPFLLSCQDRHHLFFGLRRDHVSFIFNYNGANHVIGYGTLNTG